VESKTMYTNARLRDSSWKSTLHRSHSHKEELVRSLTAAPADRDPCCQAPLRLRAKSSALFHSPIWQWAILRFLLT
jgi:hypothetical protein